jgi:hypothetical protein
MVTRFAFGLALVLTTVLPTTAAADPAQRLFVYGDSLAVGTKPYIPDKLPNWRVKQDVGLSRHARQAAAALRARGDRLSPVVHLSLGTVDDPARPRRYRRAVRRAMRAAGPERCVVWANIYRPSPLGEPGWGRLNRVLDREAERRDNLVIVDWFSIVAAHPGWRSPVDGTHVNERGYRYRARAVAAGVHECNERLAAL